MEPITISSRQLLELFGIGHNHAQKLRREGIWKEGKHFTKPNGRAGKVLYIFSEIKKWALCEEDKEVLSILRELVS